MKSTRLVGREISRNRGRASRVVGASDIILFTNEGLFPSARLVAAALLKNGRVRRTLSFIHSSTCILPPDSFPHFSPMKLGLFLQFWQKESLTFGHRGFSTVFINFRSQILAHKPQIIISH